MHEAAVLARNYFDGTYEVWKKSEGSPVTEADKAVDALLKRRLTDARPDYGWLSEETEDTDARLSTPRQWIIDPIDGTRAFIKRQPFFTVCGALIEEGRPIAAVVINPAKQEVFTAQRGRGAVCNGKPARATQRAQLAGARMLGPKAMYGHVAWAEPWPEMIIDNPNSIAYRLCLVGADMRDACLRLSPCHEWDVAAAHLFVEEAGGTVATHAGGTLTYNKPKPTIASVVAAGPNLIDEVLRRTRDLDLTTPR